MRATDRWRPTAAHIRAVIGAVLFSTVAVLARRPDLLVLATPLVGASVWATLRRPTRVPDVSQSLGHPTIREGEATMWHVAVNDVEGRIEDVASLLVTPEWVELTPRSGHAVASLHHDNTDRLDIVVRSTRWGRRRVGPALVVASSAWAGFRWVGWDDPASRVLLTLPQPAQFDATSPPVHTPGLVGVSRSPRQGSGSEFAGIRPFQPGDRLRRIHWPRSLRSGTLHVTSTWADHDRHVVLLVDALADVGTSEGIDGRASSLDISVRAASAIAGHYIATGDRVALVMIGSRGIQRVPPATGRRHLRRVLEALANIEPTNELFDDGRIPPGLGHGPLVVMLSPLLSSRTLQRAVSMTQRGMSVLVVDCLPPDITSDDPDDPYVGVAWRIEVLQRERAVRKVREAGIAVLPWRGPGSLDAVLRDMHRHTGATMGRRR